MRDAVKNMVGNVTYLLANLRETGRRLWHNSLAEYLLHAHTSKDLAVYMKYWVLNYTTIVGFLVECAITLGPARFVRTLIRSPWILTLLKVNALSRRFLKGRTGRYNEAICMTMHTIVAGTVWLLREMFFDPERLVVNEDLVPPDIAHAMGLRCYLLEAMGIVLPMLDPEICLEYIDEAENEGINPDSCSLPKATIGMVLKGHLPGGKAVVSSNLPCDAGAASYTYFQRAFGVPIYRLDVPYHFHTERAVDLFVEDVKGMIAFLEEHTPGRMDWDRFRQMCENRNRMLELERELWDMLRVRPSPLASEAVWMSHLWHFNVTPEFRGSTEHFERLVTLARKNLEENLPATVNERYRAVCWNPPFLHFPDIFNWAERTYGLTILNDSMSYNHLEPIDTATPESMLRGWSRIVMHGPMVRHTRGPAENYLDDIFRMVRQFDLDMVWVANHVGCKSGQAMNGILREKCREKGIPLLILDYDLSDPRIVSHDNMMRQVEHFMDNVMKAPRLDG